MRPLMPAMMCQGIIEPPGDAVIDVGTGARGLPTQHRLLARTDQGQVTTAQPPGRRRQRPFQENFLKNQACWPEPPGQARTRSPSHLPGQTVIGTKALSLLFLRRKVARRSEFTHFLTHT